MVFSTKNHIRHLLVYFTLMGIIQTSFGEKLMNSDYVTNFNIDINDTKLDSLSVNKASNIEDKLLDNNKQVIQIITKKTIDITSQKLLPVMWLSMLSNYRQWQVINDQNSYMVISNLNDGNTEVVTVLPTKRRSPKNMRKSATGTPPDKNQVGFGASAQILNIRDISDITWARGRYALTLLTYDWRSNTEVVELISNKADPISVLKNISHRMNHFPLTSTPSVHGVISYKIVDTQVKQTTLTLPATVNKQKLQGSITVPINTSTIYSKKITGSKSTQNYFAATLVFTQLDNFRPYTFNINIPIEKSDMLMGKTMNINVELNINSFFEEKSDKSKQISQVYFINGSNITGPQALVVE